MLCIYCQCAEMISRNRNVKEKRIYPEDADNMRYDILQLLAKVDNPVYPPRKDLSSR